MMTCRQGGYISLRHNELRDMMASMMAEDFVDVEVEPNLQAVGEECLPGSANRSEEARLDVRVRAFWGEAMQEAFFDIRVFHPLASSYRNTSLENLYRQHERQKKREYGDRVRQVELGCFTPLVFSTTGGMALEATTTFKRLASILAEKKNEPYPVVMRWLCARVSFSLLRSALACL